ncbi:outer membrane lipoprotein carrier protein LolA [Shimia litoralis]|uniref:Outer membrane lipoprotein carrier protein LolA n=1 Tax=Shimia litoralis TaxID=420403 RepID=A0A4U7N1S0_9RHOB|nr:outer membrane lipoprotein carrier protein LolA [Shimia litoralis]TKZ19458.1 outer membrane lipoprotein carrier protein LolA [Shimia litoralis]
MSILRYMIAPAVLVAMATTATAEQLSLNEISGYLNAMKTAQSAFTQINGDGSISTGRVYIKRPGRVRFEYDPPEEAMVLASANTVAIFDGRSNQPPETYPLRRTPLSVILARNVNLAKANMVVGHDYDGTATTVTAQEPEHPEYGNIQLKFTANPVELRQWIINDNAGGQTTVILGEMEQGVPLKNTLFNIEMHIRK